MKNLTNILIAIVLTITVNFLTIETVNANDRIVEHPSVYLAADTEADFEAFMNKTAKRFVRKNNEEWLTFNKVVHQFNHTVGHFLTLTERDQSEFILAAEAIKAQLKEMDKKDAKIWFHKVQATQGIYEFLWANKIEERSIELDFELPALKVERAIGR